MTTLPVLLKLGPGRFVKARNGQLVVDSSGTTFQLSKVSGAQYANSFTGTLYGGAPARYVTADATGGVTVTATAPGSKGVFTFYCPFAYDRQGTIAASNGQELLAPPVQAAARIRMGQRGSPGNVPDPQDVITLASTGSMFSLVDPASIPAPRTSIQGRVNLVSDGTTPAGTLQGVRVVLRQVGTFGLIGTVLETFDFGAPPFADSGDSETSQAFTLHNPIAWDGQTPKALTVEAGPAGATQFWFRSGVVTSFPKDSSGNVQSIDILKRPSVTVSELDVNNGLSQPGTFPKKQDHTTVESGSFSLFTGANGPNFVIRGTAKDDRLRHDVQVTYQFSFSVPGCNSMPLSTDLIVISPTGDDGGVILTFDATSGNPVAAIQAEFCNAISGYLAGQAQNGITAQVLSQFNVGGQTFQGVKIPESAVAWASGITINAREINAVNALPSTFTFSDLRIAGFGLVEALLAAAPKSQCVVATAAYGSPMQADVRALRRWRDEVLLTGRFRLVWRPIFSVYRRFGPAVATSIAHRDTARAAIRFLLRPIVALAKRGLYRKYLNSSCHARRS